MKLTAAHIKNIRELARAATPGPYRADEYLVVSDALDPCTAAAEHDGVANCLHVYDDGDITPAAVRAARADAAYLAALDPETVEELLKLASPLVGLQ